MTAGRYYVGVDLGTSECKAALFDGSGACLSEGRTATRLLHPAPNRVEEDARDWWLAAFGAVQAALGAAGRAARDCGGIGISSQGISFVLVDAAGEPLGNAVSWLDTHATDESAAMVTIEGQAELFRRTGKRTGPAYTAPKLLALLREHPDLLRRAAGFRLAHDYLLARLGGRPLTDHSLASGTMLYDVTQQCWHAGLLAQLGSDGLKLAPTVAWSGTRAGSLSEDAAAALGLPAGVPLAVGGQDQKLAALAAGIGPDVASVSLGTASAISRLSPEPVFDPAMRLPLFSFCLPGLWDVEGVVGTSGASLRWLRETLCPGTDYATLDGEAAASPPGARGVRFYPHLAGAGSPLWQPQARGTFTGISLASTRGDLVRALLEGVAFQVRRNLEAMPLPAPPKAAVLFGGGARSDVWRGIIADVLGLPVGVTTTVEVACLGAAMCAATASGDYATLAEAAEAMRGAIAWQEPAPARSRAYDGLYTAYVAGESRLVT